MVVMGGALESAQPLALAAAQAALLGALVAFWSDGESVCLIQSAPSPSPDEAEEFRALRDGHMR